MMFKKLFKNGTYIISLSCLALTGSAEAEEKKVILTEESHQATFNLVALNEEMRFPWEMAFLPDGGILISEWVGDIHLLKDGKLSPNLIDIKDIINEDGEKAGLHGITVSPDFENNHHVYYCYHSGTHDANFFKIARGRFDGNSIIDHEDILQSDKTIEELAHSGCRLFWEDDGSLIATFGDRRHLPDEAQKLSSYVGTIVRMDADGNALPDNPFVGQEGAKPQIWAYGIRNVQGIAKHPVTGEIWFSEHGPLGGDEINILKKGANYGWPIATFGIDYDGTVITPHQRLEGVETPLVYWRPSTAPSGLDFYTGPHFPDWQGDLFVGSLVDLSLIRMELEGERILFQEHLLKGLEARIRKVKMGPDGYLYVLTDADPGGIYRLEPASAE